MNLKRTLIGLVALAAMVTGYGQDSKAVILEVGDYKITKGEFERIYKKNNQGFETSDLRSVEDYMELFINFKLKVIEAESMGLDTTEAFIKELAGYRSQLAKPYLTDEEFNEYLLTEAFERSKLDVNASHILVRLNQYPTPEDTLAGFNKIMRIRDRITRGESFEEVAKGTSDDPQVKRNSGNWGYLTVFSLIYPLETLVYNTDINAVSMPLRTDFGYHLIKVNDVREARGNIKVAHIMVAVPENSPEARQVAARKKVDSIYQLIEEGRPFEDLAKELSDDKSSGQRGGLLQWFGVGKMVPEFEDAAYSLSENGQISKPVRTGFGWHIIKRIERKPIGTLEEVREELESKVRQRYRMKRSQEHFVEKLKSEYNFVLDENEMNEFYLLVDSTIFSGEWDIGKKLGFNAPLFTFANNSINQEEFADYLRKVSAGRKPIPVAAHIERAMKDFVNTTLINYENDHLEEKHPDFRYLMQEYHDGILLFELMDRMVWSKAMTDSSGLEKFFNERRQDYLWDERIDITTYKCQPSMAEEKLLKALQKKIKKNKPEAYLYKKLKISPSDSIVVAKREKYLRGENPTADMLEWVPGTVSFQEIAGSDHYEVISINAIVPPTPKELNETRGLVTADFQNHLEIKWVEGLRKKYGFKVNRELLKTVK